MDQAALQRVTLARSVALSVGQPGAPVSSKVCAHRSWVSFSDWMVLGGWVEFVLDSAEPLGCYVATHCRYCTETKTLGKHLNSSAGNFSAWHPLTVHVWEIALQLRPQAVSYTMFYWLHVVTVLFSLSTWHGTWLVADHDWSPTLPYVTVLGAAPRTIAIWPPTRHSLLLNTSFSTRQVLLVLDWKPEQEPVRGLWEAKTQLCTANAFLCRLSAATIKNACFTFLGSNQFVWCIFWVATQWLFTTVSMADPCSWLFLLGPAPFAVCFASLLDGEETHIWLGDLRFAFCGVFVCGCFVLLICHTTWPQVSM